MQYERSGIVLLLSLLLIFCSVLGSLYAQPVSTQEGQFLIARSPGQKNNQARVADIMPLIITRSVEKVVDHVCTLSGERAYQLLQELKSRLTAEDFMQIIFGSVLCHESANRALVKQMFDLLLGMPHQEPLFYVAAYSSYPTIIPKLLKWVQTTKQAQSELMQELSNAYKHAVRHENSSVLIILQQFNVPISKQLLSDLLWQAASNKLKPEIVRYLLNRGANANYAKDGYTVLMVAVIANDPDNVALLLKTPGIDVNKVVSDEIGSALLLVLSLQLQDSDKKKDRQTRQEFAKRFRIEQLLRQHGAQESLFTEV